MKKMRRSLARAEVFEGGVQPGGAVIFLSVFGQPVATSRRTRLEGVLAVLGEIRGGGPVWDVESGGTVGVLVADCQRPQSRARLKPETMIVTFQGFSPTHDFFDYTGWQEMIFFNRFSSSTAFSIWQPERMSGAACNN